MEKTRNRAIQQLIYRVGQYLRLKRHYPRYRAVWFRPAVGRFKNVACCLLEKKRTTLPINLLQPRSASDDRREDEIAVDCSPAQSTPPIDRSPAQPSPPRLRSPLRLLQPDSKSSLPSATGEKASSSSRRAESPSCARPPLPLGTGEKDKG
ncbi:unnamed protein product [Linum trigynum]|uniref:Uncharacterized protein n=1 Tax=Linum trigynum TaxID=586398 RepID=A0AAV2FAL8_9ROSI